MIFHLFSVSVFVFHDYPFCLPKGSISIWIVSQRADRLRILIELIWQPFSFPPFSLHSLFFASNQAAVIKARIKDLIFHYIDACWTEPWFAFSFSNANWTQRGKSAMELAYIYIYICFSNCFFPLRVFLLMLLINNKVI